MNYSPIKPLEEGGGGDFIHDTGRLKETSHIDDTREREGGALNYFAFPEVLRNSFTKF
jgi:hypothetical protein